MHCNSDTFTEREGGLPDRLRAIAADEVEGRRPVLSPANSHDLLAAADEIDRLRCLLERHFPTPENQPTQGNAPPAHSNQSEVSVRPECATALAWTTRPFWVDPAAGWSYGFPRLYDPSKDGDMNAWLVSNGYPQYLADKNLPCTFTAAIETE